ncbi:helix-turn-helix domain-containing protein [Xanthobacter sp.]|uniref:helix-turn-helix domain-containing protein n=1 Tax=Xanthobacter sp. TaxID=35809 RepID=UPI001445CA97|nr:helix-turn-helix domain-containing protein [Xanthobacter sp.]
MSDSPSALFDDIASVIGAGAALALFRARGGGRISIPARAPDGHWLVELIGRPAADALCDYFRQGTPGDSMRGAQLDLPRGPTGVVGEFAPTLARAKRVMAEALDQGASADEAARRAGLTRRTAYRMRKRSKGDPRQGDLF